LGLPSGSHQPSRPTLSPQAYLDAMIRSRGYSTSRFKTLQTAYYNKPTPLQQASYDIHLIELVRQGEIDMFRKLMTAGISPNPCNQFGESLVHMICRRGATEFLKVLMSSGCSLQVSDDYGRTPLHDACWAAKPSFETIDIILRSDRRLLHLTDCRGAVPLSYVRKDHWKAWLEYLESRKNELWPVRNTRVVGEEAQPELAAYGPMTRPLINPPDALPTELAGMVASGRIKPDEARFLMYDKGDATADMSDEEGDGFDLDDDDDDDDDCSDYDSDDGDDACSLDEAEMADILNSLTIPARA